MKRYRFKNGTIEQSFKSGLVYYVWHKFNGLEVLLSAKEAYDFINSDQLIINF